MKTSTLTVFALVLSITLGFVTTSEASQDDNTMAIDRSEITGNYQPPTLIDAVRPARMAVNNREIEGYITLELLVNEEGRVEQVQVLFRSSMIAVRNAVDAVARWKFQPATVDGIPTKALVAYNVPMGPNLDIFQENSYQDRVFLPEMSLASTE